MSAEPIDRVAINRTLESIRSALILLPGRLAAISNEDAATKSSPGVWSKKEELGHLIDSASNNHQRIVRAQMESGLALPGYDGDRWVELHGYQLQHWHDLITRWRELNRQLLSAAEAVPNDAWSHALTIGDSELMTLGFVFVDYLRHMAHHLRHIGVQLDDLLDAKPAKQRSLYPEKPAPTDHPINELMVRRWSPRALDEGRPVEREKILTLLEAARWAPSSFNDQPRYFLVFDGSNPDDLERARACLVPGNAWAIRAPMLMLSVAREAFERNGKPNRHGQHDTGLATENLLLQAVELGLVTHAMAGFDADRARSEFGIPEGFTPMAMIAIAYPFRGDINVLEEKIQKGDTAPRERKPIGEIAFNGKWGLSYKEH
jgi:nitroreductase